MKTQIILVLVLAALAVTEARRRRKGCKYDFVNKSECDPNTNKMTKTFKLREGSDQTKCQATKTIEKRCRIKANKVNRECKGMYDFVNKTECDPATKTMTKTLKLKAEGDSTKCPPMRTMTKRCRVKSKCVYKRDKSSPKPECVNGQMTFTLQLKAGSPSTCKPTETKTKRCRNREDKAARKEAKRKQKQEKKEQRKANRLERKKNRKAEKRANRRRQGTGKCKYDSGQWEPCDQTTDTMMKTLTLKSGQPSHCEPSKVLRKKCRKFCKYSRGSWSTCNKVTGLMERKDTIKPNSADFCSQHRTLTKKCKKSKKHREQKCKYKMGGWEDCDPVTKNRTKTFTLISGDVKKCKATKKIQRSCIRPDGRERCFFGPWKIWEACQNGVQKKQRDVLQGDVDCQKRAVRTRGC